MAKSLDCRDISCFLYSSVVKNRFCAEVKDRKKLKETGGEFSLGIISNRNRRLVLIKIYCVSSEEKKPPVQSVEPMKVSAADCKKQRIQFSLSNTVNAFQVVAVRK